MRTGQRGLVALLTAALITLLAPTVIAADGGGAGSGGGTGSGSSSGAGGTAGGSDSANAGGVTLTPAILACIKKVLTPAQVKIAQSDPFALTGTAKAEAMACANSGGAAPARVSTKGAWLTKSPVDLAHITAISQFRSCAGHDYSGANSEGQTETDRSMKHYLVTDIGWSDAGAIRGYAPFAGTVQFSKEQSGIGSQMRIYNSKIGWSFVLFHVTPLVSNGAKVKAGQPVATWPGDHTAEQIQNSTPTVSFDFALVSAKGAMESPFLHMAPAVARQWAAKGFTAQSLIVSKQTRDASPCNGVWRDTPGGTGYVAAS